MKTPISKKCCFCLPLRKALLCIGYLRLSICVFSIVQLTLTCMASFKQIQDSYEDALTFLKSMGSIVTHLLDLIFTMNFICAAHKKSVKLFEVYYLYCITMLLVYSLAVVLVSCDVARFNLLYCMMFHFAKYIDGLIQYIAAGIGVIVLQTYLTVLVRSETLYLKERNKAVLARQRSCTSFRLPKLNRVE